MPATLERMDGESILPYFEHRIAAELRLPEALDEKLLCPFRYFGAADPVSVEDDRFRQAGRYNTGALEAAFSYSGERPISMVWQLEDPMPAELLAANRVGG
ncbi:MAG: hypothetical protein HY550_07940 [Elusimicrobia bacterium]|nr:hypothetical protein [Elusimicrobiota bacterium]